MPMTQGTPASCTGSWQSRRASHVSAPSKATHLHSTSMDLSTHLPMLLAMLLAMILSIFTYGDIKLKLARLRVLPRRCKLPFVGEAQMLLRCECKGEKPSPRISKTFIFMQTLYLALVRGCLVTVLTPPHTNPDQHSQSVLVNKQPAVTSAFFSALHRLHWITSSWRKQQTNLQLCHFDGARGANHSENNVRHKSKVNVALIIYLYHVTDLCRLAKGFEMGRSPIKIFTTKFRWAMWE